MLALATAAAVVLTSTGSVVVAATPFVDFASVLSEALFHEAPPPALRSGAAFGTRFGTQQHISQANSSDNTTFIFAEGWLTPGCKGPPHRQAFRLNTCLPEGTPTSNSTAFRCDGSMCELQKFASDDCTGSAKPHRQNITADGECRTIPNQGNPYYSTWRTTTEEVVKNSIGFPRGASYLGNGCHSEVVMYTGWGWCMPGPYKDTSQNFVCSKNKTSVTMNRWNTSGMCSGTPVLSDPSFVPGMCRSYPKGSGMVLC